MIIKQSYGYISLIFFATFSWSQPPEIAITIDDLPFVGTTNNKPSNLKREEDRFNSIMNALIENNVPAIGFVIAGTIENGQWQLLENFKNNGFTLGNHTYSHPSLNQTTAEKYIENIDHADRILEPLMPPTKYFRYPYLAESHGEKKLQVQQYLTEHHYVIAPVTIDTKDFNFNGQLLAINWRNRSQHLDQIKKRYLAYIWNQTLRAEKRAGNKPTKQILLIHANLLNSHCLGDIIQMYKEHGYRFITLDEALAKSDNQAPSPTESGGITATELNANITPPTIN